MLHATTNQKDALEWENNRLKHETKEALANARASERHLSEQVNTTSTVQYSTPSR